MAGDLTTQSNLDAAVERLTMPNGHVLQVEYPRAKNWAASWSIYYPDIGRVGTTGEQDWELVETYGLTAILEAALSASNARAVAAEEALREIRDLEPEPFAYPADWDEQIAACEDCQRYRDHPIQRGICDRHRRPIWDRESHDNREEKRIGWRAKSIARTTLASMTEKG